MAVVPYEHIAALIRQGRKIEAIKLLREATGVSLKEAKDEIERLSRDLSGEERSGMQPEEGARQALPEEVRVLAEQGKKIEAIKLLREQTGLSLKEAKARVEEMTGRGGCLGIVLLFLLTGALLLLT